MGPGVGCQGRGIPAEVERETLQFSLDFLEKLWIFPLTFQLK
jgi:hypothetical protein